MKVAMLVPGGVDRSGTERVIPVQLWLIERLATMGHEIHVYAHAQEPEPGEWPLLGALVHNAGRTPRRLRMLAGIAAEHRRAPFDVLHAFWVSPAGAVAAVAGRVLGVPVLLHLPGGDLTDLREIGYGARARWQGRAWARLALAGATRITAPSEYIVQQARALGVRVTRLPHGVALDRWPPRPPRPRLPAEPARLLHVGSLNAVKDQEKLLRAALRLREMGVPFRLDVIGHDTLGGAVQRRAAELGLAGGGAEGAVRFHGSLTHADLRPWMERADLLLVTSRHEAGPLVLLEAAVAGVPTVGTAVGLLTEWAPDAAVAVPVRDHTALADAAAALLLDEERRLTLAARAQARALREDADLTARATVEIYGEIRRATRPPPAGTRSPSRTPAAHVAADAGRGGCGS